MYNKKEDSIYNYGARYQCDIRLDALIKSPSIFVRYKKLSNDFGLAAKISKVTIELYRKLNDEKSKDIDF